MFIFLDTHTHLSRAQTLQRRLLKLQKKYPIVKACITQKEYHLLLFFFGLFGIVLLRLFRLQVVQSGHYEDILSQQHLSQSTLKAKRGSIYVTDRSGKPLKLTENIDLFTAFVDPKFVKDKTEFIRLITPLVYKHFCQLYEMRKPTLLECVENIQRFTNQKLLPEENPVFYL
jgi:cell division protein FtsI/penicillin-binding protein 2